MIVFLVGPSGVGKTALSEMYSKEYQRTIVLKNVDKLLALKYKMPVHKIPAHLGNWDTFWLASKEILDNLKAQYENHHGLCIVDIGAGTLQAKDAGKYFINNVTVTIIASRDDVHLRNQMKGKGKIKRRSIEEFSDIEYSAPRQKIYDSSGENTIDVTGLDIEQAYVKFKTEFPTCIERLRKRD